MPKKTHNLLFLNAIRKHFICRVGGLIWETWTCRQSKLRGTKDQDHQQELMCCLFPYRHSLGSSARVRLFNVCLLLWGSGAFNVHPFHSLQAIRRLFCLRQYQCHCALSRQVVLLCFSIRNRYSIDNIINVEVTFLWKISSGFPKAGWKSVA